MSVAEVLGQLFGATTADELVGGINRWLALRLPAASAELLVVNPASRALVCVDGSHRPHVSAAADVAHANGTVEVARDSGTETVWVPLRGLLRPVGLLGITFPRGEMPTEGVASASELGAIVAISLDRRRNFNSVGLHRSAFVGLADLVADGVVVASDRGQLAIVNAAFCRMVGWSVEEIRARGYFECVYPDPAARARAVASTRQAFAGEPARDVPWRLAHRDGHEVECTLDGHVVSAPDGRRYILAVFHDRTVEAERVAEERRGATHAELGRLAAAITHDVNNLLMAAQGHAELLLAHAEPAVRSAAGSIVEAGERATRLTRQLAAFGRDQAVRRTSVAVVPIVEEALRSFRSVEGAPTVTIAAPTDLPAVEGDATTLCHLFLNLLGNAGEAAGRNGKVHVEVSVCAAPDSPTRRWPGSVGAAGWVRVRVFDNGPGFSREARARLLEPFFTTKGIGRGLGLAAAARIAEAHDAILDVPQRFERGAAVDVYLPVSVRAAPAEPVRKDPAVGGTERVWVVDDDVTVRDLMEAAMEMFGYVVCAFPDAASTLAAVDGGERPDLLISDVVMPGMDGFALYRALRARGVTCPVLFVSGYNEQGAHLPVEHNTSFLQKPAMPRVLGEHVRRLLNYVVPR